MTEIEANLIMDIVGVVCGTTAFIFGTWVVFR